MLRRWRPAGRLDRQILLGRRPAADRARRVRRMDGVHEPHSLVGAERNQKLLVALDEGLLPFRVELASDRLGLHGFEPKPMQHRDQPRAALINGAEFLLDIRADLARRTRARSRRSSTSTSLLGLPPSAGRSRRSQTASTPQARPPGTADASAGPFRHRQTAPQRRAHGSNRRREGPTRSRAAPSDAPPTRLEPTRSTRPGLPQKGSPLESWTN